VPQKQTVASGKGGQRQRMQTHAREPGEKMQKKAVGLNSAKRTNVAGKRALDADLELESKKKGNRGSAKKLPLSGK